MKNIGNEEPAIAIIGGSGIYDIEGTERIDNYKIKRLTVILQMRLLSVDLRRGGFFFFLAMAKGILFCLMN